MSDRLLGRRIEHLDLSLNVDKQMKQRMLAAKQKAFEMELELNTLVSGRPVKILSDWNGQPYGRSRRSMKGREMTVERAHVDAHWGVYLFLRGERVSIRAEEVEWL